MIHAGFDQTQIEIHKPYYLAGFTRSTKTDVVEEPLFITTSAFQTNEKRLLVCMIDCVMVDKEFTNNIKKDVYIKLGIKKEEIIIAATHTHSAPAFIKMNLPFPEYDATFAKLLHTLCIQSIQHAVQCMEEVEVVHGVDTIEDVYGNRNIKNELYDNTLHSFHFFQGNERKGLFINMSCHPTIINQSSNVISSDLIGGLRRHLFNKYHVPVCISNGACGDTSTRFYRKGNGREEVERCSRVMMAQMKAVYTPCAMQLLAHQHITLQSYLNVEQDSYARKNLDELQSKDHLEDYEQFMLQNYLYRLTIKEFYHELECDLYCLDAFYIVTIPGELVSVLGERIKQRFPEDDILFIAYANDYACYLVDKNSYGKYFESKLSETPAGIADELCEQIVTSIQTLKEETKR